jgi:hypothetical protein
LKVLETILEALEDISKVLEELLEALEVDLP